jgi:Glu-tRNA(Gln) amidotransferase subunit E-like FAD-binding protein
LIKIRNQPLPVFGIAADQVQKIGDMIGTQDGALVLITDLY